MQKIKYILLFLSMLLSQVAFSQTQQSKVPTLWKVFISVGYSDATSDNINQYYNLVLDSYRSDGISIPTQIPFGKIAYMNTGFLLTRLEDIWFGICAGFAYSPAYSSYKDYAGTLKIKGSIISYELSFKIKATLTHISDFPITVSTEPGVAYVTSSVTQELRFLNYSEQNYDWNWSAWAWGPFFQGTLGTSIPVGNFIFSLGGGYRFSWNKVYEVDFGNQKMYGPVNIGLSGVIFLGSIEIQL